MNSFVKIADTPSAGSYAEKVRRHLDSLEGRQGAMKVAVAEELWLAMERTGTNKAELARRTGTSPQYITKVFRGTTNFTLDSVVALFHHVGYDLQISAQAKAGVSANLVEFVRPQMKPYAFIGEVLQPLPPTPSLKEQADDQALTA